MGEVQAGAAALAATWSEVDLESGDPWRGCWPTMSTPSQRVGAGSVALLPALDPTPMGYVERDWFLGPHAPALFDRSGNIGPIDLV